MLAYNVLYPDLICAGYLISIIFIKLSSAFDKSHLTCSEKVKLPALASILFELPKNRYVNMLKTAALFGIRA
jgi:hypothetical protein